MIVAQLMCIDDALRCQHEQQQHKSQGAIHIERGQIHNAVIYSKLDVVIQHPMRFVSKSNRSGPRRLMPISARQTATPA